MKLFGYVRVSTKDQADRETYVNQENAIKRYLKAHPEITVVEWFKDKGISGTKTKERKEFIEMLDRLNEVDGIITYDISRMSRDLKTWSYIMFELRDSKKVLVLAKDGRTDDYNANKTNILTSFIEGYVAADERENTVKRIKEGIVTYKGKHGRWGRIAPKINWKVFDKYTKELKPPMALTVICQMPDISDRGPVSRSYLYKAMKSR